MTDKGWLHLLHHNDTDELRGVGHSEEGIRVQAVCHEQLAEGLRGKRGNVVGVLADLGGQYEGVIAGWLCLERLGVLIRQRRLSPLLAGLVLQLLWNKLQMEW